jgi:putative mycofactocin binding protein MftB
MRLARNVKFREEKFGGVLFETRSEKVYTLTPTAAAVVQEIAAGRGSAEIAPRLAERFEAPAGTIEREVTQFLAMLRDKGLVED